MMYPRIYPLLFGLIAVATALLKARWTCIGQYLVCGSMDPRLSLMSRICQAVPPNENASPQACASDPPDDLVGIS